MSRRICLATLTLVLATSAAVAAPVAGPMGAPPTEGAAPEIVGAMATEGARIADGDTPVLELWLVKDVTTKPEAAAVLGASFASVPESALVGLVRLHAKWTDYKGSSVPAGLYTLRYAIQPADGNHMGVSDYRDFLLLVPADKDVALAWPSTRDELWKASAAATGTRHPPVMALVPRPESAAAASVFAAAPGQWALAASLGPKPAGIVVLGHATPEGY